jgi:spore coat polysaccharide biosynthesis protein SpsF
MKKDIFFAFIQCRLGSKRLKKKTLKKLGNYNLLEWVVRRVKKSKYLNKIIVLTSTKKIDNKIVKICNKLNIECIRGSENNVFSRFLIGYKIFKPKYIVRVCADNPFIDPVEIDKLILKMKKTKADYLFNHIPYKNNNYIDGVGAECIKGSFFLDYKDKIKKKYDKEHVTSFIWNNKKKFSFKYFKAPKKYSFPKIKLDID